MKRLLAISLIFSLASSVALADTYIHGSVGEADFNSGGNPDMYDIGLGFSLSSSLSLEVTYVNLGTVDNVLSANEFLEEEADGYNISLVADLPLNEMVSLYFSAGRLNWDDVARYYLDGVHVDSYIVKGKDWNFGGGIKAEIYQDLDIKFGLTKYELDDIEVESISAGLIYRF